MSWNVGNETTQPIAQHTYLPADAAGLTPDALMAYCQTRLNDLDGQVKGYFDGQQKANADRNAINDALAVFTDHADGLNGDGNANGAELSKLEDALSLAITAVGEHTAAGQKLKAIRDKVESYKHDDNKIDANAMKSLIDQIKDVQTDINSGSELGMIQLQSLMSQRQVAIQMCTNLVQSLGDQANKIAANIGH